MSRGAEPRVRAMVVFAMPDRRFERVVELSRGSTLADAVREAGLLALEPSLAGQPLDLGVFGKVRPADTPVRDGDRVEVYRPLTIDPKEARRVRADLRAQGRRGGRRSG